MLIHENRPDGCVAKIADLPPGAVFTDLDGEVCLRTDGGCVCLRDGLEVTVSEGDLFAEELPGAVLLTHGMPCESGRCGSSDDDGRLVEWCPVCGGGIDAGHVLFRFEAAKRPKVLQIECPLCRAELEVTAEISPEFRLVEMDSKGDGAQAEQS